MGGICCVGEVDMYVIGWIELSCESCWMSRLITAAYVGGWMAFLGEIPFCLRAPGVVGGQSSCSIVNYVDRSPTLLLRSSERLLSNEDGQRKSQGRKHKGDAWGFRVSNYCNDGPPLHDRPTVTPPQPINICANDSFTYVTSNAVDKVDVG